MVPESNALSPECIAIFGAAVALAGLILHGQRIVHRDVDDLRRDAADLRERMAKLERAVGIPTRFLIDRERGPATDTQGHSGGRSPRRGAGGPPDAGAEERPGATARAAPPPE